MRLIPLVLVFYVPALMGVVLLKERGESYKVKSAVVLGLGFGGVVGLQLLLRSGSTLQVAMTAGLSLLQIAVALLLAALTVYKLAD